MSDAAEKFKKYERARRHLEKATAALVLTVLPGHMCPAMEKIPMLTPPDHTEQRSVDPTIPTGRHLELVTSGSSDAADLFVEVDAENVRVGDLVFPKLR